MLSVLVLLIAGAGACTRAKAKTMPDAPPLEMPPAPPREVEPNESEPPPPVSLPQEPARTPTPRPRPAPTRETRSNEAPKPSEAAKPAEAPPVIEPPKTEEPPPTPPPTLQTTPTTAEGEVERSIRAMLTRASNDLNRIDYRILNADGRTQYDTAKRFISQADAAISAKNLVFAKTVAEKAAALAAQLGGR